MSPFRLPWRRADRRAAPEPARVPDGSRLYVFGDVHGRLDLLRKLGDAILDDQRRHPPEGTVSIVGLGDYVDRGPDSSGVIDRLLGGVAPGMPVYLRGNHEEVMLAFLADPVAAGPDWLRFGGTATLRSYGVDTRLSGSAQIDFAGLRDALAERLPAPHRRLLEGLPTSYQAGDYFFAHAGVRPGTPLDRQSDRDLLWIREGFADRDVKLDKVVVHGHTPVEEPYLGRHRINLDTGAYFRGRLSCLVLEGPSRRMLAFDDAALAPLPEGSTRSTLPRGS